MAIAEQEVEDLVPASDAGKGSAKIPFVPLIAAVLIATTAALGAAGGAAWWLVRSGRLSTGAGVPAAQAAIVVKPPTTHEITLEPLLVNLADEGGRAYLRITMTLVAEDAADKKDKSKEEKPEKGKAPVVEHNAVIRDAALTVIGRDTTAELLAPEGKEALKRELRVQLGRQVPEMKIADLYFTEFLVQR